MITWLKFWKLDSCLMIFINDVTRSISHRVPLSMKCVLFILFINFFHLIYLSITPLSIEDRLANYDPVLFWQAPQIFNFVCLATCIQSLYLLYQSYFGFNNIKTKCTQSAIVKSLLLIKQIYFNNNPKKYYRNLTNTNINKIVVKFNFYYKIFYCYSLIGMLFLIHFLMHFEFITLFCKHWQNYLTTFKGFACLLKMLYFKLSTDLEISATALINMNISIIGFTMSNLTFIRLRLCSQLISNKNKLNGIIVNSFLRNYTKTLVFVLNNKFLIGQYIIGFIIAEVPCNTYLSMIIYFQEQLRLSTFLVLGSITSLQWSVIFCFHFFAALLSSRLHSCPKRLAKRFTSKINEIYLKNNLKMQIKLWLFIEKINTNNKYGLSYGHELGLISFSSFSKVKILFYCSFFNVFLFQFIIVFSELAMYWYQLTFIAK